jgi:hypothetical protein
MNRESRAVGDWNLEPEVTFPGIRAKGTSTLYRLFRRERKRKFLLLDPRLSVIGIDEETHY